MSKQTPTGAPASQPQHQPSEQQEQRQSAQEAGGPVAAGAPGGRLGPGQLRALQGAVGNRAVQRVLGDRGRQAARGRVVPAHQLGPVWRSAEQPALFHKPPPERAAAPQGQIPVAYGGGTGVVQRVLFWSHNETELTSKELKQVVSKRPDAEDMADSDEEYYVTLLPNRGFDIQPALQKGKRKKRSDDDEKVKSSKSSRGQALDEDESDVTGILDDEDGLVYDEDEPDVAGVSDDEEIVDDEETDDIDFDYIEDIGPRGAGDRIAGVKVSVQTKGGNGRQSRSTAQPINNISPFIKRSLYESAKWYKVQGKYEARFLLGEILYTVKFNSSDPVDVATIVYVVYIREIGEPQPRSGAGRAARNEEKGRNRAPYKYEAKYGRQQYDLLTALPDNKQNRNSEFTAQRINPTTLRSRIVHKGPWGKGPRDPGQSAVMGGQNAKNYAIDVSFPTYSDQEKEQERQAFGRWEWLHLVGSSLGGLNTANNLVAGTYDANTKMIPLEHRVARWGAVGYDSDFKPTEQKPITITTTATVVANTHLASRIQVSVLHGTTEVANGDYTANTPVVLTKDEYKAEEKRVEAQIEAARARLSGTVQGTAPQPTLMVAPASLPVPPSGVSLSSGGPSPFPPSGVSLSSGGPSPFPPSGVSLSSGGPSPFPQTSGRLFSSPASGSRSGFGPELKQPIKPPTTRAFMSAQPVPKASGVPLSSPGFVFAPPGPFSGSTVAAPPQQGLIGLAPFQQPASGPPPRSSSTASPPDGDTEME